MSRRKKKLEPRRSQPRFAVGDQVCFINSAVLADEFLSRKLARSPLVATGIVVVGVPSPFGMLYNVRVGRQHVVVDEAYVSPPTPEGEVELLHRVLGRQLDMALNGLVGIAERAKLTAVQLNGVREIIDALKKTRPSQQKKAKKTR